MRPPPRRQRAGNTLICSKQPSHVLLIGVLAVGDARSILIEPELRMLETCPPSLRRIIKTSFVRYQVQSSVRRNSRTHVASHRPAPNAQPGRHT